MNKYDWWIVGLGLGLFVLFMLCATVQTAEPCKIEAHEWADTGVTIPLVRDGAKPVDERTPGAVWYGLEYYHESDLERARFEYCRRCGLVRLAKEAK